MSKRRKRGVVVAAAVDRQRQRRPPRWRWLKSVMMLLLLLLLIATTSMLAADVKNRAEQQTLIIKTDTGQLFMGTKSADSQVAAFLGLRYAGAPVKRLRFMPPTPFTYASSAKVVHDARYFGSICMQRFPVDFSRQQLDQMHELTGGDNNRNTNTTKTSLQLDLMRDLLPGGSFFGTRRQRAQKSNEAARKLLSLNQSEDCLNLNIYTPIEALKNRITPTQEEHAMAAQTNEDHGHKDHRKQQKLLPVLVIIQADSFDYGSTSATINGLKFARDNRLLVVTFNFRLNLLGFPPLNQLLEQQQQRRQPSARTNLGLLDQVALLHWLQTNVRSFGGSPRNVTLMGVRLGAIFVNLLMLSPLAKGLFAHAILEDGTALSPVVANNLHSYSTVQTALNHKPQPQQQVALQHMRILAHLSGCHRQTGENQSDLATNWLECLKSAPIEQLMQQIPFGLLDIQTIASGGGGGEQVTLARRWHRPLELLFRTIIELDHRFLPVRLKMTLNEFSNSLFGESSAAMTVNQQVVTISRMQLDKLIAYLVTTKQAISKSATTTPTTTLVSNGNSTAVVMLVNELLDELLGAIYLPSNETLATPLFAPHLDTGTLLQHHEHDLTSALLAPRSLFSRHDLLIGSSRPIVTGQQAKLLLDLPPDVQMNNGSSSSNNFDSIHLPVERFGRRVMEKVGLSDEQAIQQVNLFVKTFYRFHQQEIANSIINHYFLNDQQMGSSSTAVTAAAAAPFAPSNSIDFKAREQSDNYKQLHLLHSIINMYQDSLISVPLIKTALIHSMKQLESLAELYISQRITKLDERIKFVGDISRLPPSERETAADAATDNFQRFVSQIYDNSAMWPVQLMGSTGNGTISELEAIHSTYLYQSDGSANLESLLEQTVAVINGLATVEHTDPQRRPKARAIALADIRRNLVNNLLYPMLNNREDFSQLTSLSCGLQMSGEGDDQTLPSQLIDWLCARTGRKIVAKFVARGNINQKPGDDDYGDDHRPTSEFDGEQLDKYETDCIQEQQQQQVNDDHHLVVAPMHNQVTATSLSEQFAGQCREQLDRLSMAYLYRELSKAAKSRQTVSKEWRVFDVFEQQMATLRAIGAESLWSADGFAITSGNISSEEPSRVHSRDHFDRKIAFWANFIPTLNCSRTQPIGPNSLLLFTQAANSTLLNMNLNFNCQSAAAMNSNQLVDIVSGTRTANSLIRSLETKIKLTISEHLNRLLIKQQQHARLTAISHQVTGNQNHHSLRMAAMNEMAASASAQQDDPNSTVGSFEQQTQTTQGNVSLVNTWLTVDEHGGRSDWSLSSSSSSLFSVSPDRQTLFSLWFIAGTILLGYTILTSGCVLMKHLKRQQSPAGQRQLTTEKTKTIGLSVINDNREVDENSTCIAVLSSNLEAVPEPMDCQLSSSSSSSISKFSQRQQQNQKLLEPVYEPEHLPDSETTFQDVYEPNQQDEQLQLHQQKQQQQQQQQQQQKQQQQLQFLVPTIPGNRYIEAHHLSECSTSQLHPLQTNIETVPQAFSSGSETTTTQRALSSVSLQSSSTITTNNNTNSNCINGKQRIKKRVKISDPKRHFEDTYVIDADQLMDLNDMNSSQVYLNNGSQIIVPQLEQTTLDNFCPIHRSNSTYLISSRATPSMTMNSNNCDTTHLNHNPNRLEFANNHLNGQPVGLFPDYMSASESFNGTLDLDNSPQLTTDQHGPVQGNHIGDTRSINRKQQRGTVKQRSGPGRVCLVYNNRIGLNNNVMNAGTSDQISRVNT